MENYDIIIIGAGSVGVPAAMFLAEENKSVLVIDKKPSPGQGQNKKAIGGIRATHSDRSKILIAQKSIEIFSNWEKQTGDDIEWYEGGYSYPVYSEEEEKTLKELLKKQQSFGLDIKWVDRDEYLKLVPMIKKEGLIGSTYSPHDGSASPLKAINSFYVKAEENGAEFNFNEKVEDVIVENDSVKKVKTDKGEYCCGLVINAAGGYGKEIGEMVGIDIPVNPDSHEAGITEPVERMFDPMIVDIREAKNSKNYYFYQHKTGQIVFCITPKPPIVGKDTRHTSVFLPQVSKRMLNIMPRLKNINIRRTWRGLYPMTPDGFPIVGEVKEIDGFYNLAGMCGQGFMLGPGLGYYMKKDIIGTISDEEKDILEDLSLYRDFSGTETLK